MGGKAKPKKHTAKEMAKKAKNANMNKGGGKAGAADRKGGKAGHAKLKCPVCMQQAPSMKSMKMHWESKHHKLPWDETKFEDTHKKYGGTVQGVAVAGSANTKKTKRKTKAEKAADKRKAKQVNAEKKKGKVAQQKLQKCAREECLFAAECATVAEGGAFCCKGCENKGNGFHGKKCAQMQCTDATGLALAAQLAKMKLEAAAAGGGGGGGGQ